MRVGLLVGEKVGASSLDTMYLSVINTSLSACALLCSEEIRKKIIQTAESFRQCLIFVNLKKFRSFIQHELLQGIWSRVTICLFIKIKNFISWIVNLLKLFKLKMYVDISTCIVCQLWFQL